MKKEEKFKINNLIVKKKFFFSTANNLNNSIFIEACAGSGKTKLIIIRIIHLLIKYNNYKKILILTFTRISLLEIKKKIKNFFFYIAKIEKKKIFEIFIKYGFLKEEIEKKYIKIKNFYKIFLFKSKKINFFTFHSWFLYFLKKNFFFKKKYNLLDNTKILISETYKKFLINLQKNKYKKYKKYFLKSKKIFGEKNTKKILKKFILKRDEWLFCNKIFKKKNTTPLKEIKKICKKKKKIIFIIWKKKNIKNIKYIINIYNKLTPSYKKKSLILSKILISKPSIKQFKKLYNVFYTKNKKKRKINILKKKINYNLFKIKYDNIINILNINNENYIIKYNKIIFNIAKFFLKIYKKKKKKKKILDFLDLEYKTYLLLNNKNKKININFKHIIIDEFQDINIIQWKIINSIVNLSKKQNKIKIFFVGDPKQSIYNFRKSDFRIFFYIKKFLKKNKVLLLQTNVTKRNSIKIIDLINNTLVKKNFFFQKQYTTNIIKGEILKLPLINYSNKKKINNFKKKKINIERFKEGEQIAKTILLIKEKKKIYKNKYKKKIKWKDFLILIKTRKYLKEYEKAFKKYNIPYISDKKKKIFNTFIINNLIILLKFLTIKDNKLFLIKILKSNFFLISKKDLKKILKIKKKKYIFFFFLKEKYFFSKKTNFILIYLFKWIKYVKYFSIFNLLKLILKEYKLISLFHNELKKNFKKIKIFFKFIFLYKNLKNLTIEKFIIFIKFFLNKKIYIKKKKYFLKNAIHIITIHKSKGLESPIVILPDTNHTNIIHENVGLLFNFPYDKNNKLHFSMFEKKKKYELTRKKFFNIEKKIKFQENLNILYVALTRAKELLIISGIKNKKINKKNIFENWYQILFKNNKKYKNISNIKLIKKEKNIFYIKNKYYLKKDIIKKEKKIYIFISYILKKNKWPLKFPNIQNIKNYFSCSYNIAKKILNLIFNILNNYKLEKFFNPTKFVTALNNVKIYKKKKKITCNRIIFFKKEIWILNYNLFILNKNLLLKFLNKIFSFQKNFYLVFPSNFIKSAIILNNNELIKNK